jgi:hypothetical protein
MINWHPEYIALLSRVYRERVLRLATPEGYLRANAAIAEAAQVRPLTVEAWMEGRGRPNRRQGERLVRWAGRVIDPVVWEEEERRTGIGERLAELIGFWKESKQSVRRVGRE